METTFGVHEKASGCIILMRALVMELAPFLLETSIHVPESLIGLIERGGPIGAIVGKGR